LQHYPFSQTAGDYLLYVGRIDEEKGVHYSIDAAVKSNKKLIIAAKLDDQVPKIKAYFEEQIKPRLEAHPDLIQWIGEVDEVTRNELMTKAYCLLHAVTWPEPFGLTLIEAMACGCPVIAFNQGAIPEIVVDGKTGFVVENVAEMVAAIKKIRTIDRSYCREYSINNFSANRMAEGYVTLYEQVIAEKELAKAKKEIVDAAKKQKLLLGFGS
jgi:glycosyltransferase involved in cell wall biosynthesis